jgi:hypothetical protein
MEIHIDGIRHDLQAAAAALGDEAVSDALRRLSDAVEPSLRLRIIDLLSEAALRLNGQLDEGHIEVRLAGREPELVYVDEPEAPEGLKSGIEVAAAREGVSTNAWIVRALARAVEPRSARRSSNRLQGFARS